MNRVRVMIVDDHAVLRGGLRALLSSCDEFEVVAEASDGREALLLAREFHPDIVVMDIAMPNMDGLEATRRLRKEHPHTKTIVLTQYCDKEYVLEVFKSGARGIVPKRALASDLIAAMRAIHQGDSFIHPSVADTLLDDYLRWAQAGDGSSDQLTNREKEVLKLIAEGRTNKEVAQLLLVSPKTALGHRANLMKKLGVHNRTELVKYAIRKGLIPIDA